MSVNLDGEQRINLSRASLLLVEANQHALDLLGQIAKGIGVQDVYRCLSVTQAEKIIATKTIDLIIIDPTLRDGDGYAFIRALRQSGTEPNCYAPIIMVQGHVRERDVARVRDAGANFVVAKPITPDVLLQRILWVARDTRPFVKVANYIGPDRRFKFKGPPAGSDGRRGEDLTSPLGDASAPNMSTEELDLMIKPQRVAL